LWQGLLFEYPAYTVRVQELDLQPWETVCHG